MFFLGDAAVDGGGAKIATRSDPERTRIAESTTERHRPVGVRPAAGSIVVEMKLGRERREDAHLALVVVVGETFELALQDLHERAVDFTPPLRSPQRGGAEGHGRAQHPLFVAQRVGDPDCLIERFVGFTGEAGCSAARDRAR